MNDPHAAAAPKPGIRPKVVALWFGAILIGAGLIAATGGIVLIVMGYNPDGSRLLVLFGMLIFGVGLALLLTQIFAEQYSASIAGFTFAGTLAAVFILMMIVQKFLFSDSAGETARDLRLVIQCPPVLNGTSAPKKHTPLVVIKGLHENTKKQLEEAFTRRGSGKMLDSQTLSTRFKQVKGDIVVLPFVEEEFEFFLPEVIRPDKSIKFEVISAEDKGASADTTTQLVELEKFTLINVDITRGKSGDERSNAQITAEINFEDITKVCDA